MTAESIARAQSLLSVDTANATINLNDNVVSKMATDPFDPPFDPFSLAGKAPSYSLEKSIEKVQDMVDKMVFMGGVLYGSRCLLEVEDIIKSDYDIVIHEDLFFNMIKGDFGKDFNLRFSDPDFDYLKIQPPNDTNYFKVDAFMKDSPYNSYGHSIDLLVVNNKKVLEDFKLSVNNIKEEFEDHYHLLLNKGMRIKLFHRELFKLGWSRPKKENHILDNIFTYLKEVIK